MQVQRGAWKLLVLFAGYFDKPKTNKVYYLLKIAMINIALLLKFKTLKKFKTFSFINPFLAEGTGKGHFLYKHAGFMRTLIKQNGGTELMSTL